jgi:hypothetical protein
MRADIEDQAAPGYQRAVQRHQAGQAPGPPIDPEGFEQTPLLLKIHLLLHRVCGIVGIVPVCLKPVPPRSSINATTPRPANSRPLPSPALALLALLTMNALFLLPLWWRDGILSTWLVPELLLLPLLVGILAWRWWPATLAAVLCFGLLALAGDALVREVLDRPLNLVLDPLLLRAGYHFLSGSLGPGVAVLIAITAVLVVVLVIWGLSGLIRRTTALKSGRVGLMLAVGAVVLIIIGLRGNSAPALRTALVDLAVAQTEQIQGSLQARARLLERAESPELRAQAIPALAGRDLVVIFVESYGISAWGQNAYRSVIEPVASNGQEALRARGLEIMTTRLRSPIRGGQSWLAHASLLSGQRIDNDLAYREVLASKQDFLSDDLAATGHATLVLAPAIVRPWPEGQALGFEQRYPAAALGYRGPAAGWVGIPDQFTLHRFSQIRASHPGPAFSLLLLISSHAPWLPGPPLIEDWSLLDQDPPWPDWTPPPSDRLVYLRDSERLRARYPESLAYSLAAVFAWAAQNLPPDAVLLVLGDHQPATLITGNETSADVPVHLIGTDAASFSAAKSELGFIPGFAPAMAPSEFGLEDLREWFRSHRPVSAPAAR